MTAQLIVSSYGHKGNFFPSISSNWVQEMLSQNVALGNLRIEQKQESHNYLLLILSALKKGFKKFSILPLNQLICSSFSIPGGKVPSSYP
jgi:hypothetical protein